jgi:general secretion pathway protein I
VKRRCPRSHLSVAPVWRPTLRRMPFGTRSVDRTGLTLLEVIISVAIFLGGLTAIMQALALGQRSELSARLQSAAVVRAEAVMAEMISGASELAASAGNRFDDDEVGNWEWSAEVVDAGVTGLLQITVLVEHKPGGEEPNAAFSVVRYVRDPQLFLDAQMSESGE